MFALGLVVIAIAYGLAIAVTPRSVGGMLIALGFGVAIALAPRTG